MIRAHEITTSQILAAKVQCTSISALVGAALSVAHALATNLIVHDYNIIHWGHSIALIGIRNRQPHSYLLLRSICWISHLLVHQFSLLLLALLLRLHFIYVNNFIQK